MTAVEAETASVSADTTAVCDLSPISKRQVMEAEDRRKSSDFQSWMNSAKLNYGNAYLSIPNVFSKTGWLGGLLLFSLTGLLNIYTMMQNLLVAERHPRLHSYSEIGGKIFGKWGKLAVDIPIWIMQLSTCISYLYFIAEQIDSLVCHYTGGEDDGGYCDNKNLYIYLLTIPALPVSWIETYTFLSYFSIFGVGMAFLGMMMMFGYLGQKLHRDEQVPGELEVFNVYQFFGNIGVAMFVFEGNAVVINVRAETINQHKYPKILTTAVGAVITLFMVFSMVGYATYKGDCNSIFVLNFEPINGYITFIFACVCINCFISYPLQILVAFDIGEQHRFFKEGSNLKLKKVCFRSIIIVFITLVASVIPDFTLFLDIAGALGAGVIAFILPPLLYNAEFKETIQPWKKYSNYAIIVFGVVGCTISIVNSIQTIINGDGDE